MFILLAATQASTAVNPEPSRDEPTSVAADSGCSGQAPNGDIVVCGRSGGNESYRVRPIAGPSFEEQAHKASIKLSENADLNASAESGDYGSTRAMVTFKLRF